MAASLEGFGRTLVIAPHPDDEVLGGAGTLVRLARTGAEVFVAVFTAVQPPDYTAAQVSRVKAQAAVAHEMLGVRETIWLDQPAARLFETPHAALNGALHRA